MLTLIDSALSFFGIVEHELIDARLTTSGQDDTAERIWGTSIISDPFQEMSSQCGLNACNPEINVDLGKSEP